MISGEYNKAEKIVNEGDYFESRYNLSTMFMASGHLKKALEHAKASTYRAEAAHYNIILVLLHRKKIDAAIEVFELMSYLEYRDVSDQQFIDFKDYARDEIIKSLLLGNNITNDQLNKRIPIVLDLCNNKTTLVKVLCGANLHAIALKIARNLPSKKLHVSNYIPNGEKDECYVMIAESLMNSISSGKGLVHEVYINDKTHYGRRFNPPYCQ